MLAYAQLLRLPNVFTAFADILMAGLVCGAFTKAPVTLGLLVVASGCLYLAGMVFNDIFDLAEDTKDRPFRPLPSGRVTLQTAWRLAVGLSIIGWSVAGAASLLSGSWASLVIASKLVVAILFYDSWLKRTAVGPVSMGLCRFLNVLLGLSAVPDCWPVGQQLHLAAVVGVYIVGVTWLARTEATVSEVNQLRLAASVMILAMALALAVPLWLPPGESSPFFPYLLAGFIVYVGSGVIEAIRRPGPHEVQVAVKGCVLGLVILDAVLAVAFVGLVGLLIGLLLLPARWLGRWVYST